ncbi:MAG: peptide chain release factor N(5)-glutamine methyltransferase [Planctomycetota bacterium]|nr:peptide chain release factor N(5)-glutamine methyltransferase [Planctomycetota bacterium]
MRRPATPPGTQGQGGNPTPPSPPPPAAPRAWTTRALLRWMAEAFQEKGLDAPRLSAELLLSHALGCDRLKLYMDADRPATPIERDLLRSLVARALKHEPVQYLVNEAWFFSLPFRVDRRVLIPRPSTEVIVEHVLQHARANPGFGPGNAFTIADVCTGSGCVAIAMLKNLPGARAVAVDISPDALEVAQENARTHGVSDRLDLLEGDLLEPLVGHPGGMQLHYLVSNPPYIPDDEWESNDPAVGVGQNVRDFEPEIALRGGQDGLRCVRPLLCHGPALLRPGGLILVEVATSRADEALAVARANDLLEQAAVLNDHEGLPRVVVARRR